MNYFNLIDGNRNYTKLKDYKLLMSPFVSKGSNIKVNKQRLIASIDKYRVMAFTEPLLNVLKKGKGGLPVGLSECSAVNYVIAKHLLMRYGSPRYAFKWFQGMVRNHGYGFLRFGRGFYAQKARLQRIFGRRTAQTVNRVKQAEKCARQVYAAKYKKTQSIYTQKDL